MRKFVKGHTHLNAPQELILVRLLTTVGAAVIVATVSLYLHDLGMSAGAIGVATAVVMIINLLFALWLPALLETVNLGKILIGSTFCFALSIFVFGQVKHAVFALFLYLIGRLLLSAFISAYSILFRDDSPSKKVYRQNVALAGSLVNFSWMIAPFLATLIIDRYSFSILYIIGGSVALLSTLIMVMQTIPVREKKRHNIDSDIVKNIRHYMSQKRLRDAYLLGGGVDMYWVFIFVFLTVFLKDSGLDTAEIGLLLTITQMPLFLLEFRTYKVVDRFKYRLPFTIAYAFIAFVMLIFAVLGPTSIISLLFLVMASFSTAFLEPAREMYLYEKLNTLEEERVQPIYATSELTGSIFIRLVIGLVLLAFQPVVSFVLMGIFMGYLAIRASGIKN